MKASKISMLRSIYLTRMMVIVIKYAKVLYSKYCSENPRMKLTFDETERN